MFLHPHLRKLFLFNSQVIQQNFSCTFIILFSKRALPASINTSFSVICELLVCESRMIVCLCPIDHNMNNQAISLCSLLSGVSSRHSFAVITQCNCVFFFSPHASIISQTAGAVVVAEARKINQPNQFRESDESALSLSVVDLKQSASSAVINKTASVMRAHACVLCHL